MSGPGDGDGDGDGTELAQLRALVDELTGRVDEMAGSSELHGEALTSLEATLTALAGDMTSTSAATGTGSPRTAAADRPLSAAPAAARCRP